LQSRSEVDAHAGLFGGGPHNIYIPGKTVWD
jgi:hypothetical protein